MPLRRIGCELQMTEAGRENEFGALLDHALHDGLGFGALRDVLCLDELDAGDVLLHFLEASHRSTVTLEPAIRSYLTIYNANPTPIRVDQECRRNPRQSRQTFFYALRSHHNRITRHLEQGRPDVVALLGRWRCGRAIRFDRAKALAAAITRLGTSAMTSNKLLLTIASGLLAAACSSQQTLQNVEPQATRVALKQGQADLQCPTATSEVVSSSLIEPPPGGDFKGQRLQYMIAVAGCGKRNTYPVVCVQDGSGCYIPAPGAAK